MNAIFPPSTIAAVSSNVTTTKQQPAPPNPFFSLSLERIRQRNCQSSLFATANSTFGMLFYCLFLKKIVFNDDDDVGDGGRWWLQTKTTSVVSPW
jgi:hypothetical protein